MKFRNAALTVAAGLMVLSQPAFASAARSGSAVPSAGAGAAGTPAVSRGSEEAEGASDFLSPLWIAFVLALIGGMAAVITSDSGNNDSPG